MDREQFEALPRDERAAHVLRAGREAVTARPGDALEVVCTLGHPALIVDKLDVSGRLLAGAWGQIIIDDTEADWADVEAHAEDDDPPPTRRRFRLSCPACGDAGPTATFRAGKLAMLAGRKPELAALAEASGLAAGQVELQHLARIVSA